jgi:hypothetical protein
MRKLAGTVAAADVVVNAILGSVAVEVISGRTAAPAQAAGGMAASSARAQSR